MSDKDDLTIAALCDMLREQRGKLEGSKTRPGREADDAVERSFIIRRIHALEHAVETIVDKVKAPKK